MNLTRRNFVLGSLGVASMFGLAACGGNSSTEGNTEPESQELSQEDMLAQAEELDLEAFHETDSENEAKAKQEYDGKIFRCTAIVGDINPTYVRINKILGTAAIIVVVILFIVLLWSVFNSPTHQP